MSRSTNIPWENLDGVRLVPRSINKDSRGLFARLEVGKDIFGESSVWSIGSSSNKKKGTFRGIHFQEEPYAQSKIVWVTQGDLLDIVVDLRASSPTFLHWSALELTCESPAIFLPKGFGHAYLTLTKTTIVNYIFDKPFVPTSARRINVSDPFLRIELPSRIRTISQLDKNAPFLSAYFSW